jgi:hypothetical protein
MAKAPARVVQLFEELVPLRAPLDVDRKTFALRQAYLGAHVVSPRWAAEALHVASATAAGCQVIVSWNFRHIVNYRRIPLYNAVNGIQGYSPIRIYTPLEMSFDEDEEKEF